jgi:LysM repeat protein
MKKILVALAVVLVAQIIVGGPVAVAAPPAWGPIYHTVQWGESLSSIAARYGVSPWAIAQANGIWNPNYIRAGQVLIIPGYSPWPSPKPGP